MALSSVDSESGFISLIESSRSLVVVHFLASWAPQCSQVSEALIELKKELSSPSGVEPVFVQVEAEDLPEISIKYEIAAVPTVVLLYQGQVLDRVDGVKIAELTKKVRQQVMKTSSLTQTDQLKQKEPIESRLKKLINSAEVMVFMKGIPDAPRCGFSRTLMGLLRDNGIKFSTFDILTDDDVRQGLKSFSNWPTYPQVYVNGELVGGLDIIKEMIDSGELEDVFPKKVALEDRINSLINKAKIMLFMKGDRDAPRCGFSRQAISLLNSKDVEYETFDILTDEDVRQGLKEYSDWPTYPQLYVNGEFLGGIDIMNEMESGSELGDALKV